MIESYDLYGEFDRNLYVGDEVVLKADAQFVDKTFPAGTKAVFLGYKVNIRIFDATKNVALIFLKFSIDGEDVNRHLDIDDYEIVKADMISEEDTE